MDMHTKKLEKQKVRNEASYILKNHFVHLIQDKLALAIDQGPVSRKSRKLFFPEKPLIVKLPTACLGKAIF